MVENCSDIENETECILSNNSMCIWDKDPGMFDPNQYCVMFDIEDEYNVAIRSLIVIIVIASLSIFFDILCLLFNKKYIMKKLKKNKPVYGILFIIAILGSIFLKSFFYIYELIKEVKETNEIREDIYETEKYLRKKIREDNIDTDEYRQNEIHIRNKINELNKLYHKNSNMLYGRFFVLAIISAFSFMTIGYSSSEPEGSTSTQRP